MLREDINVLIVDDVNAMRVQVTELMTGFGFKKLTAVGSVDEAKGVLAAGRTQLVICDWHMTPVDGLELLKYIRSQATLKEIAFLMLTAESTKEKVLEAVKAGVDDYLIKPLMLEQIQTKVQTVLVKRGVIRG